MDTDSIWFLVLGTAALGFVCWLLAHIARASHYSEPREFEYDGVKFWWIPQRRPSWFSAPCEHGRFEYEDGERVSDARLHRDLHEAWVRHCYSRDNAS